MEFTEVGWREKVLKIAREAPTGFGGSPSGFGSSLAEDSSATMLELRNSSHNPPSFLVPQKEGAKVGEVVEVSPEGLLTIDSMAKTIKSAGGAILNVDYGEDGVFSDSVRAIKDHKYVPSPHFWQMPGLCDLSAYVNFAALGQFAYL